MRTRNGPKSLLIAAWPWWVLLLLLGMLTVRHHLAGWPLWTECLQEFTLFVCNLLLPALPFVVVGRLVSTMIATYLTDTHLRQMFRRGGIGNMIKASLLGVAFPVSGSDAVQTMERMLRQGCSPASATAFLLAAPVLNPIVLVATWQAFGGSWEAALLRGLCAWLLALFVADLLQRVYPQPDLLQQVSFYQQPATLRWQRWPRTADEHPGLIDVLQHACNRLFEIGRWMIVGALLIAAWRIWLPSAWQALLGQHSFITIPLLMAIGWLMALPSEGDAFLLRALIGQFTGGSLLAWLLVGPVLNRRSLSLLLRRYDHQFVRYLFALGTGIVLLMAIIANMLGIGELPSMQPSSSLLVITTVGTTANSMPIIHYLQDGILLISSQNFSEMMEALWAAGEDAVGLPVEMIGFVYSDPSLGPNDFVLARQMVMDGHEETAVAGLLCRWPQRRDLQEGQWVQVNGRIDLLSYYDLSTHETHMMPFIQAERLTSTNPPEEPYVYP